MTPREYSAIVVSGRLKSMPGVNEPVTRFVTALSLTTSQAYATATPCSKSVIVAVAFSPAVAPLLMSSNAERWSRSAPCANEMSTLAAPSPTLTTVAISCTDSEPFTNSSAISGMPNAFVWNEPSSVPVIGSAASFTARKT